MWRRLYLSKSDLYKACISQVGLADRVRDRERMRKWKSIQSKPADHKRDWNQSRAVDVPLTRQRHQRGGYGRRQKYRDQQLSLEKSLLVHSSFFVFS